MLFLVVLDSELVMFLDILGDNGFVVATFESANIQFIIKDLRVRTGLGCLLYIDLQEFGDIHKFCDPVSQAGKRCSMTSSSKEQQELR